ncbi:MAG: CDP-alcohol phosphatidyltransferase family protein [Ethanoligenens sp.]
MTKHGSFKTFGIPNWLSVLRLALIPVFIVVFFSPHAHGGLIAAAILGISGLTDVLDGIIARHFHMTTDLGKILSPFADKLTPASVCGCRVLGQVAPWWLFVIFVAEALMIIAGARMLHTGKTLSGAKWFGKLGTVVFYVVMVSIIVFRPNRGITDILIGISLLFMLFSLIMYIPVFVKLASKKGRNND